MESNRRIKVLDPVVVSLGKRIYDIIKEKGFKTREVAHDANLDVENLRKYIKGKQEMKITTLLKIKKALGVSIEDLFDFE